MAAAITTQATTLEGQLIEIVAALQLAEGAAGGVNNVTGNINTDTNNFTGTFNIPMSLTVGAGGQMQYAADPYLT